MWLKFSNELLIYDSIILLQNELHLIFADSYSDMSFVFKRYFHALNNSLDYFEIQFSIIKEFFFYNKVILESMETKLESRSLPNI